jgi:hypothetical protein
MGYLPKMKSRPAQKEALKLLRGKEAFALLMAMRTGKTKVVLDDFGEMELAGEVQDQLVIAPAGVYRTWETAIRDHMSEDILDRMLVHTWSSGAGVGERRRLEYFMSIKDKRKPRTLLMNVEALSRPGDARKLVSEYIKQRRVVTNVDESTIIKNNSERTKFVTTAVLADSDYRRILSGLATPRSPLDLFYQFLFLDWRILGHKSYWTFRAEVAIMRTEFYGGRRVPIVVGYRPEAVEALKERIAPHSFRVPFRPKYPSTYTIREVELTKEQKKAYAEMKEFSTTNLGRERHVTATVVIAQIMKLHQILLGHVTDENRIIQTLPENRTAALLGFLEDYDGKAVIWAPYDHDIRKIAAALRKEYGPNSVACFWGGNANTREAEEKRFLNDPVCRFEVATQSAGGRGRTWTNARLVIYYASTDNLEHREQSEQRTLGEDNKYPADFVDFIVPGTVETKILEALRKKIDMSSFINGDNYREWII